MEETEAGEPQTDPVKDEGDGKLPVPESAEKLEADSAPEGGRSDADPAPTAGTSEAGQPSRDPQGAGEEEKGETHKEAEVEEGGGAEVAVGGGGGGEGEVEREEGERADIPDFIRQPLQDVSSLPPATLFPPPTPPQPETSEADTEALTAMKL